MWWTFVVLNLAGVVLILGLAKAVYPLLAIWWNTRSQEAVRLHQQGSVRPGTAAPPRHSGLAQADAAADPNAALQTLTNQLGVLDSFSATDLEHVIAQHFGSSASSNAPAAQFDMASAVFDTISRTNVTYNGQTFYGYRIVFVDQSGLRKTNIDCYAEPNLDYERSMATLDLINRSPQLKRLYQAMSGTLAAQATANTNQSNRSASQDPLFRLEPE